MSLALATLLYEWRRYMAAVIALALSGLLILATLGMFIGMGKAFSATIDHSPADIIILSPKAESLDGAEGLPNRILPAIYVHPEVKRVAEMARSGGRWQNHPTNKQKQKDTGVDIIGVDPRDGSPTMPSGFSAEAIRALKQPFTIVVDESVLGTLGVKVGDEASINSRNVRVGATTSGYANMMEEQVFMTPDNMRLLGVVNPFRLTTGSLMVTLKDPSRAEIVRDQLNKMSGGKYRAWTRPELAKANETLVFGEAVVGIMLGFLVVLGIGIGIGITSQTLRGAILANIKEFASLRALGVAMGSLRIIVIELSFWVGVVGIGVSLGLIALITVLAHAKNVPMYLPPNMTAMVCVLLMLIAMISGFFALGMLKKSQPADLLR